MKLYNSPRFRLYQTLVLLSLCLCAPRWVSSQHVGFSHATPNGEEEPVFFFPAQRTLTQWGRRARWRLGGQGHDMRRVVGLTLRAVWSHVPGAQFSRLMRGPFSVSASCPHILTVGSDRNQSGVHIGASRIEVNPVGLLSLVRG